MNKVIAAGMVGLSLLAGSAYSEIRMSGSDDLQNRININIPTDQVKVEDATTLINFLSNSIKEGKSEVSLADALADVDVPADYKALVDKILASRDPLAFVECSGRTCKITSKGRPIDFKIDGLNLPVVGVPAVFLSKDINIYAKVSEDNQSAEICRMEGVAVKVSILKSNIDGAIISIEDGAIKTLLVDAGVGGDYPTKNCDFVSSTNESGVN